MVAASQIGVKVRVRARVRVMPRPQLGSRRQPRPGAPLHGRAPGMDHKAMFRVRVSFRIGDYGLGLGAAESPHRARRRRCT